MLGFNNSWLRFHLHGYVGLNTGRRFPLSPNLLGRAFSWELLGPAHSKNVCASHSCVSHCKNVCATHLCVSDSHSHGFPCVEQSSFYFLSFFSFFFSFVYVRAGSSFFVCVFCMRWLDTFLPHRDLRRWRRSNISFCIHTYPFGMKSWRGNNVLSSWNLWVNIYIGVNNKTFVLHRVSY
jgi:hypothetical protein